MRTEKDLPERGIVGVKSGAATRIVRKSAINPACAAGASLPGRYCNGTALPPALRHPTIRHSVRLETIGATIKR
jgi:hypothetical protein